jgi:hypothetical protein
MFLALCSASTLSLKHPPCQPKVWETVALKFSYLSLLPYKTIGKHMKISRLIAGRPQTFLEALNSIDEHDSFHEITGKAL